MVVALNGSYVGSSTSVLGKGEFNILNSNERAKIERSYKRLVSLISNGEYSIERDREHGIFIRFHGFYEDIDDRQHGREYKVWIR